MCPGTFGVWDTAGMDTNNPTVAVLGAGKMGEILAAGMVRSGVRTAGQIIVTDANSERVREVAGRHGFSMSGSNREAVEAAGVVVLAVKPKDLSELLSEIGPGVTRQHVVLSIAAGVPTKTLEDGLGGRGAVVRAMPNAASAVGEGITAICPGSAATDEHLAVARELLEGVGPVISIGEGLIDAVTAVSGSGPAYFALFAEAMIDAGVTVGLPRDIAGRLVAQTMRGTAAMVTEGKMEAAEVRAAVTSPGGTTAMAIRELERAGVRAGVLNAVQAAFDRARALGGNPGKG
jgi:pyrroline-5-carboxylate reductase